MVGGAVIGGVVNSTGILGDVVIEVGRLANWIQAIGLLVILWIAFQVISLIVNRKKRRALYEIRGDLKRIESKLDKVLGKRRNN